MRKINKLIIHCSDTDAPHTAEDVNRWHIQDNGWDAIGYNYFIEQNSFLSAGRPLWQVGAHCKGHNSDSIGVCLAGREKFTVKQFARLAELIEDLQIMFPEIEIFGHSDLDSGKTCPNFDVRSFIDEWL